MVLTPIESYVYPQEVSKWFEEQNVDKKWIVKRCKKYGASSDNKPNEVSIPYDKDMLRYYLEINLKAVTLGVTNACNLRCKYCIYGD